MTRNALYFKVTFSGLSSLITQLPDSYRHVRFTIFEYLVTIGYNLFQIWTCIIRDLSDRNLLNMFNAWWAAMNVGSTCPIAWNISRHVSSGEFHLHCGIDETSSLGIIYVICHQVLHHPSEHGTSFMGKNLLARGHIAMLNELAELEVTSLTSSMVDESPLAILKRQGSRGITVASSQRNMIVGI